MGLLNGLARTVLFGERVLLLWISLDLIKVSRSTPDFDVYYWNCGDHDCGVV